MKLIHIIAGVLALVSGFVALYALKGGNLHRRSGTLFAYAMLVLTSTGALMATFVSPNRGNVVAGVLTFYLVSTSLLTVRRTVEGSRRLVTAFMLVALVAGAYAFGLALEALHSASGTVDKIPAAPLFMFGTIGLLAAALDARMLLAGRIEGAHRLARHLWRMGYAMWIATLSFFLGQAKLFPGPVRESGLLAVPVVVVAVTLLYWLGRVLLGRRRRLPSRVDEVQRAD
ncbi:MAG: hypothetical protein ACMG5Z_08570 [Luteimonas sp.]